MSSIPCANRFIVFAVFHPSLCFLFLNSAALDLAHIYQTSPRASFATRIFETRDKSSKWPQFAGSTHPDGVVLRADRRTVMNPNLTLSAPSNDVRNGKLNTVSTSATPHVQQHPQLVSHPTEAGGRGGANAGANAGTGSTVLYHHNGSRYGLGLPARTNSGAGNSKMNGLYGPKHKHGDMNREFNRFARMRLEDLQGEIPALCKDQHGCWYLQKKLEEGSAEHRDMIFMRRSATSRTS
ncbi:hypothetical protein B0H14DRAFT_3470766 [Mycena olivaceomarginata]|nr:hypothetical protein B0H14DRAFT_3470766 [Mycena olivaceomarginata]